MLFSSRSALDIWVKITLSEENSANFLLLFLTRIFYLRSYEVCTVSGLEAHVFLADKNAVFGMV